MIPRRWRRDEVNKTCYTLVLASTTWNKWIKYSHDPNQQQRWDRKCIEDGIFFHFYWTNISFHTWAHQPKPNQMKVYRFWTTQTHTLTHMNLLSTWIDLTENSMMTKNEHMCVCVCCAPWKSSIVALEISPSVWCVILGVLFFTSHSLCIPHNKIE